MLCPICGGEIGNEIRLCEKCQAATTKLEPEAVEFDENGEPIENATAEGEADAEGADGEASPSGSGPKLVLSVVATLILTGLACFYFLFVSPTNTTPSEPTTITIDSTLTTTPDNQSDPVTVVDPETGVATTPVVTSPHTLSSAPADANESSSNAVSSDPSPVETTVAPDLESAESVSAWIEIGKSRVYLNGAYIRLDNSRPEYNVLEIGMYPEALTDEERKLIGTSETLLDLWAPAKPLAHAPAAILTLRLRGASKEISTDSLMAAELIMTRETGVLSFGGIDPQFQVKSESSNLNRVGVTLLKGKLEQNESIRTNVRSKARAQISMTLEVPIEWNFTIKSRLHPSPTPPVH